MTTLYRTDKFDARIKAVKAMKVFPKFAIVQCGGSWRKERLNTLYHRYHTSFDAAKRYLMAEWRIELKKAKDRLDFLQTAYETIEKSTNE